MVLSFIGVQLIDVIVKRAPKGQDGWLPVDIIGSIMGASRRKALIVVRTLYIIIIIIIADLSLLHRVGSSRIKGVEIMKASGSSEMAVETQVDPGSATFQSKSNHALYNSI
jgi:hypothetical protein